MFKIIIINNLFSTQTLRFVLADYQSYFGIAGAKFQTYKI